ncbi:MAG: hypothetical protein JST80_08915 [Bdellovibrionales bacterium]|nr:hypothetical protein [Bdellovibrionales bacterium]
MKNVLWLGCVFVALSACSPAKFDVKHATFNGENAFVATKDQIINKLQQDGVLEGVQTSSIDRTYEIAVTNTSTRYFIKDNKVVSMIRNPQGDETKLIYWRYKFQGKLYRDVEMLSDGLMGHRLPLRQIACDDCSVAEAGKAPDSGNGVGVIYDPSSEQVKRVFYYDSH